MDKYNKEAEEVDLEFIRFAIPSDNLKANYRTQVLYKIKSCGHNQFIDYYCVRRKVFVCRTCQNLKIEQETQDANLTFIRKADESYGKDYKNVNLYMFNNCRHEQYIQQTRVRHLEFVCRTCVELKYDKEAHDANLIMIRVDPVSGKPYKITGGARLYRFNNCGHEKSIKLENVRTKAFCCNECQKAKIENEALKVGLTFLRNAKASDMKTEHKNHGFFRFNDCGHEQAVSKSAVRVNNFCCWSCNTGAKDRSSSIYLFKFTTPKFEWLKLGFSSDPEFRRKKYKLPYNCKTELLYELSVDTGEEAWRVERELHSKLKASRLCPSLMRNYMQCSGFTECYPVKLEEQLLEELYYIKELNE